MPPTSIFNTQYKHMWTSLNGHARVVHARLQKIRVRVIPVSFDIAFHARTWIDIDMPVYLTAKLPLKHYPNVQKPSLRVYTSYSHLEDPPNERLRENVVARYTPATNDCPRIQHARLLRVRIANDYHQKIHSSLITHQGIEISIIHRRLPGGNYEVCHNGCRHIKPCCFSSSLCSHSSKQSPPSCVTLARLNR